MRLIDADALELEFIAYFCGDRTEISPTAQLAVKMLINNAPTIDPESLRPKGEWISVKDKLPEEHETVLVLCKNGAIFTGYQALNYDDDVRWRIGTALGSTKLLNKGRVTHWMPLPEPPKEATPNE